MFSVPNVRVLFSVPYVCEPCGVWRRRRSIIGYYKLLLQLATTSWVLTWAGDVDGRVWAPVNLLGPPFGNVTPGMEPKLFGFGLGGGGGIFGSPFRSKGVPPGVSAYIENFSRGKNRIIN